MFINKKQKGYGWYSKITSKDMEGKETTAYINFSFKRDCEPNLDTLEGDLYFVDKTGHRRKIFAVAREYNGQTSIDFKLLEDETEDNSMFGGKRCDSTKNIIEKNDLPFY